MATGAGPTARVVERHGAPRGGSTRSKSVAPGLRRPSPSPARARPAADHDDSADSCRVRVAIRLRPKNADELAHGADFDSCVELQPECKRLKLKKNNWISESYKFDEVFTENASQKRVYEVVAKPVVESRGIMLYLESVQDLLAPDKANIPIAEDPKTGEVSLPGAAVVEINDLEHAFQLLQIVIHLQRSSRVKEENGTSPNGAHNIFPRDLPLVLKSKLLIVDLAGSERIDKSGSEGHMIEEAKFINLSLTSLGKCINALAENSPHIPTRDSKLTRILRDSFGGTARTSLVVTIGPSARHYSETSSTIMFGQRAMKIVNTIKLKEEVDYEILYKKMEREVDRLTSEMEREQKLRQREKMQLDKKLEESTLSLHDLRMTSNIHIEQQQQLESLSDTKAHEKEIGELLRQLEEERCCSAILKDRVTVLQQQLSDAQSSAQRSNRRIFQMQESMARELEKELSKVTEELTGQVQLLKEKISELMSEKELVYGELKSAQEKVQQEIRQRQDLEDQIIMLKQHAADNCAEESKTSCRMVRSESGLGSAPFISKPGKLREALSGQKGTISKIFEEVGLPNVVSLLKSEELEVQIYAVKVVANLAAEDINQERIVEEGGLDALLSLLETSENTTIHRVTAGAVANLAMNGPNQGVIMNKGGARLLANVASKTDDPQTLRMVAGAIANLCGNEKLHLMLKQDGGIKALLGMFRTGHNDVIAQIARGIANFAKCESRVISQGHRKGRSLLIEDGVLTWMVANSTRFTASTRRHIELAFCHLAQNKITPVISLLLEESRSCFAYPESPQEKIPATWREKH
ncbi:hypothetical protein ACP70R_016802 [Stipagrostis hirtigluma subsp. patula]